MRDNHLDFDERLEIARQDYAQGFGDAVHPVPERGRQPVRGRESASYWLGHYFGVRQVVRAPMEQR